MNELAQYFTKEPFSALLASCIDIQDPKLILDLGIGNGSLTTAAQKKWKDASFFGVDVDSEKVANLFNTHTNVSLFNLNSLDINLGEKINIKAGSVDIAICNPPYLTLERSQEYSNLLTFAGLNNSTKLLSYTTDLLFIAQNLSLLKDGGVLGIILPAGLLCGHHFELFRKDLVDNHSIESIIELQSKIFKKTEAKTFILILKKGKTRRRKILLSKASKGGLIIEKLFVDKRDLYHRMDFEYHSKKHKFLTAGVPLKNIITSIKRGNLSNLQLRQLNVPYFHTTDFKSHYLKLKVQRNLYDELLVKPTIACEGDILIGRVGKTCHRQVLLVVEGEIAVSDCVYIIKAPKDFQCRIFSYLISEIGMENLLLIKHGVCAQVISKKDLELMIVK